MDSHFRYSLLRKDEVRLLRVTNNIQAAVNKPTSPVEGLDVSIEVQTFSHKIHTQKYTALSYRWGSLNANCTVIANGGLLKLGTNLYSFLREVTFRQQNAEKSKEATVNPASSPPWCTGWLWIDAICIDQNNVAERNQQVNKMREIYQDAYEIVIWLGLDLDDVDEVIEAIESLADLDLDDEEQGTTLALRSGDIPGHSCKITNGDEYVEMLYTTLFDLAELLNDEYWSRAWIIQEASTPKDIDKVWICLKGGSSVTWSKYAAANQRLLLAADDNEVLEVADLYGIANSDIATVKYIQDRRVSQKYEEPLYTMLVHCRTAIATDPRDKIYAVVGMTRDRNEPELRPDYGASMNRVYELATKSVINTTRSLDCLGSAHLLQQSDLPSWVPDWSVQYLSIPQPFYQYEKIWERDGSLKMIRNLFQASATFDSDIRFSENGKQLMVTGFRFDTVTKISLPNHRFSDQSVSDLWTDWHDTANLKEGGLYVSGCTRIDALEKVVRSDIAQVWGDWSAERGHFVDVDAAASNPFEADDPILNAMTWNRRLFNTEKEYLGLASDTIHVGDVVCILFGSQMPMILRKQNTTWLSVGQAYIHGLMDGEAVELQDGKCQEVFAIV